MQSAQQKAQQEREAKVHHSYKWQQVKKRVKAATPYCKNCYNNKSLNPYELQVDHIIPMSAGGAEFDERNLQVLCYACHKVKGDLSNPAGVAMRRGGITEEDVVGLLAGYKKCKLEFLGGRL